jgi:hypothetical protein
MSQIVAIGKKSRTTPEVGCLVDCNGAAHQGRSPVGRYHLPLLPALAVAVIPKCPLCWAAWVGVATTLGLGRIGYQAWLLPAMAAFLGVVLTTLAWRDWRQRQFATAILLLLGGSLVIGGRLAFEYSPALYAGLSVLVVVTIARRFVQV